MNDKHPIAGRDIQKGMPRTNNNQFITYNQHVSYLLIIHTIPVETTNNTANVCLRHAIMAFKLMKCEFCEGKFVQLNFQLVDNPRQTKLNFFKIHRYDVGKNVFLSKLYVLNGKIDKTWLNLSLDSLKMKFKELFLK